MLVYFLVNYIQKINCKSALKKLVIVYFPVCHFQGGEKKICIHGLSEIYLTFGHLSQVPEWKTNGIVF